jgi:AraC family transcriptional regulator, regulatory protein of adaptative response / methylated-DNA-[protein]-cysteine methyltransferase
MAPPRLKETAMPHVAPLTATAATFGSPTSAREALEVLASATPRPNQTGRLSPEAQMPLYRKKSNADEEAATARWRAVHARDRAADGSFVFAVKTTGVYCRPSCPARRPKRENVSFFGDGAAAQAAGFRACRRCTPDALPAIDLAVAEARRILDEAQGESVSLTDLAAAVGLSPAHLQREFGRRLGLSPKQYALAHRAERLKRELAGGRSVLDAGFEAGYGSASGIYGEAARSLGMTPGRFRNGGRGVRISYALREASLGQLLVAATARGLCAARLGASATRLRAELAEEFPQAELVEDETAVVGFFEAIEALLDGSASRPPLDIEATPFQARVWQALTRIPRGTTVSYGELARAIGKPSAVRAVAAACAANPLAIVVPCHRVVGRDGALTGYRWGVKRKRQLLRAEAER